jgi:2,4-dienoyl-CoA reductase-like NADH-dependent reductase (Old Yellow Enzyme family)
MSYFTELPRGGVRLGAAGKIMGAADAMKVIEAGCDYVLIGRGAILRHDFPEQIRRNADYVSPALPVSAEHLRQEGLGPAFIKYMQGWKGFVSEA